MFVRESRSNASRLCVRNTPPVDEIRLKKGVAGRSIRGDDELECEELAAKGIARAKGQGGARSIKGCKGGMVCRRLQQLYLMVFDIRGKRAAEGDSGDNQCVHGSSPRVRITCLRYTLKHKTLMKKILWPLRRRAERANSIQFKIRRSFREAPMACTSCIRAL